MFGGLIRGKKKETVSGFALVEAGLVDSARAPLKPAGELDDRLDVLRRYIADYGMAEPVLLSPNGGGRYRALAGSAAVWAAADLGLKFVPAIVRGFSADEEAAIVTRDRVLAPAGVVKPLPAANPDFDAEEPREKKERASVRADEPAPIAAFSDAVTVSFGNGEKPPLSITYLARDGLFDAHASAARRWWASAFTPYLRLTAMAGGLPYEIASKLAAVAAEEGGPASSRFIGSTAAAFMGGEIDADGLERMLAGRARARGPGYRGNAGERPGNGGKVEMKFEYEKPAGDGSSQAESLKRAAKAAAETGDEIKADRIEKSAARLIRYLKREGPAALLTSFAGGEGPAGDAIDTAKYAYLAAVEEEMDELSERLTVIAALYAGMLSEQIAEEGGPLAEGVNLGNQEAYAAATRDVVTVFFSARKLRTERAAKRFADEAGPIVAAADSYRRLVAGGVDPHSAMEALDSLAAEGRFSAVAVAALSSVLTEYPPGSRVELSDGSTAKVLKPNREEYTRPVVFIEPSKFGGDGKGRVADLVGGELEVVGEMDPAMDLGLTQVWNRR